VVEALLPRVTVPARILQSKADGVVKPESAQVIYDRISSSDKKVIWFEKTNHEMMRDVEKEAVFAAIMESLREFGA
jgi:carboxylesterase